MKKKILINGSFLCRRLTGIERYAYEITNRLDKICKPDEVSIIIPKNTEYLPSFTYISIIKHNSKINSHLFWHIFTLQLFLLTHRNYIILDFGNTALPFFPGIVFLHDIYCEIFKEDFSGFKDKIIRLYNRYQYRLISGKAKKIVTVSQYSKEQISKTFSVSPDKIKVIYSSADHFRFINPDLSIFDAFPVLNNKPFYFSLGSLSKRKNIKWIIEYAKKNPRVLFAVSGTSLSTVKIDELDNDVPSNIMLLGYLDDSKIKALMAKCKAFLLPSYYEGFGLTPLEALTCGAPVIVANAASLPEIYGKCAHYIDPFDTNIDLNKLLQEPVEAPDKLFEKYSYDKSAEQVYELIKEILNE